MSFEATIGFTLELALKDDGSIEGTLQAQTMQGTVSEGSFDKSTGRVEITFTQDDRSIQLSATVKDNTMTGTLEVAGGLLNITFEAKRGGGESPGEIAPKEEPELAPEQPTPTPAPADPVTGVPVANDPLHYISKQEKIVEEEDKAWAL